MEKGIVLSRAVTLLIFTVVAGAIIWRGHTYTDLTGGTGGLLTPLMCSVAGLFCFLTGIALACRSADAEVTD